MAGPDSNSSDERTEAPTQFRREEFRKKGAVALSREVLSIGVLLSVGLSLFLMMGQVSSEFGVLSHKLFSFGPSLEIGKKELLDLGWFVVRSWSRMALPFFLVAVIAGSLMCAVQVGWFVTFDPLTPDWERINPVSGFGRVFSGKGAVEALKASLKIAIVGIVVWIFLQKEFPRLGGLFSKTVPEMGSLMGDTVWRLFGTILFSLSAVSGFDYWYQRFQLDKQLRMTKREAKDEFKLREGDPLIKSRIRSIQRRMATRRMMEQVPKADVVVTNPTHFAIALKYDSESMHAPKVTAKGAGHVALKIKELAYFHRVPVVENKPLARTLFKEIEVNHYVPRELYKAVAEVLAYVYRLKRAVSGK